MAEEFQIVGYDDDCSLAHIDEVGSIWGKIKKGVRKVGKVAGKVGKFVAKSPLVKIVATGAAFVFPPFGVPALAAIAAANALVAATKDVGKAGKALGVIKTTRALAATGDVSAQRAVSLLATAARGHKPEPRPVARAVPPRPAVRPPAPRPRPPVKATPRPPVRAAAPRPAARPAAPAAAAAPVVQGFLIHTAGAERGRIDFSGGRWRRA
jgi:hypothetical protein